MELCLWSCQSSKMILPKTVLGYRNKICCGQNKIKQDSSGKQIL